MMAWQNFSRLLNDRSGNFGMMTAVLLPVLLGAAGVALDLTNMMVSKTQLQEAADSAALAASTALASGEAADEAAARELAKQFFLGQASNTMGADAAGAIADTLDIDIKTTPTTNGKKFQVHVGSSYDLALTPLMGVFGYGSMNIATSGTSTSGTEKKANALSLYLVLDRSLSMGMPQSKMQALKSATAMLLGELNKVDPDRKLVRTGAVSYNHGMQTPSTLAWGTSKALDYVNALYPDGFTNSGEAVETAYKSLAHANENSYHKNKNGDEDPSKYIVFMTDGENNISGADNKTLKACKDARDAGMEVYSVAFMAPKAGKKLLSECASTPAHYFEPEDAKTLIEAFKAIGQKAAKSATRLTS